MLEVADIVFTPERPAANLRGIARARSTRAAAAGTIIFQERKLNLE